MSDLESVLTITPQVVAEVTPSEQGRAIIHAVAEKAGCLEHYIAYSYGSAYYVELPKYIDLLLSRGEKEQAMSDAALCFTGNGIPDDVWGKMVQVGR
jgi:hypothetical protein